MSKENKGWYVVRTGEDVWVLDSLTREGNFNIWGSLSEGLDVANFNIGKHDQIVLPPDFTF